MRKRRIRILHASLGDFLGSKKRAGPFFLGNHYTQVQAHVGRLLRASLRPFLRAGIAADDILDAHFHPLECACSTNVEMLRANLLGVHSLEVPFATDDSLLPQSDIWFLSQIDYERIFNDNRSLHQDCRLIYASSVFHLLRYQSPDGSSKDMQAIMSTLSNCLRRHLLSSCHPILSGDYQPADILQLFLHIQATSLCSLYNIPA
ncbi:hypothetical protein BJ165DRAFT_657348 [Panaeolus papilionaceus]|nr:hypothetical protein BJ165DRAFT_657348 [Panaeolus papilionaceus]